MTNFWLENEFSLLMAYWCQLLIVCRWRWNVFTKILFVRKFSFFTIARPTGWLLWVAFSQRNLWLIVRRTQRRIICCALKEGNCSLSFGNFIVQSSDCSLLGNHARHACLKSELRLWVNSKNLGFWVQVVYYCRRDIWLDWCLVKKILPFLNYSLRSGELRILFSNKSWLFVSNLLNTLL